MLANIRALAQLDMHLLLFWLLPTLPTGMRVQTAAVAALEAYEAPPCKDYDVLQHLYDDIWKQEAHCTGQWW